MNIEAFRAETAGGGGSAEGAKGKEMNAGDRRAHAAAGQCATGHRRGGPFGRRYESGTLYPAPWIGLEATDPCAGMGPGFGAT